MQLCLPISNPCLNRGLVDDVVINKIYTSKLLFNEDFEGNSVFKGAKLQSSTSYGFKVVADPVYEGEKSGRFELRDTDLEASNGTRVEFLFPKSTLVKEGWYAFDGFFPASHYEKDSNMDHINQWHQGKGSGSPALQLLTEDDQFKMLIGGGSQKHKRYVLGNVQKDVWQQFVIHVIHSPNEDGLVEVWLNGERVLKYSGPTMYAEFAYPRWKIGIYKDDWNGNKTTDTKERIFYVDNVKLGSKAASLNDMRE